ncbi:MAG: hypothetical protein AABX82_02960 [Nanoarchaeota archaeon]
MLSITALSSIPARHAEHGYFRAWGATQESAQVAANVMQTNGQIH